MSAVTVEISTVACPPWCTAEHDQPGSFHAGPALVPARVHPAHLRQYDSPSALPGVVVSGWFLTEAQAHELGMALVRAADVLRRARQEAQR